jgi:hypothetical protein
MVVGGIQLEPAVSAVPDRVMISLYAKSPIAVANSHDGADVRVEPTVPLGHRGPRAERRQLVRGPAGEGATQCQGGLQVFGGDGGGAPCPPRRRPLVGSLVQQSVNRHLAVTRGAAYAAVTGLGGVHWPCPPWCHDVHGVALVHADGGIVGERCSAATCNWRHLQNHTCQQCPVLPAGAWFDSLRWSLTRVTAPVGPHGTRGWARARAHAGPALAPRHGPA